MKYLPLLAFIFTVIYAHAQTGKGSFLVSGSMSFSHGNSNGLTLHTSNTLSITPRVGYFLMDHVALGVSLPLSVTRDHSDTPISGTSQGRSIGIGPFIRYYIPIDQKLYVVTEAGYSWNYYHSENSQSTTVQKQQSRQLNFGAGVSYFINKNVGIELLAGYRKLTQTSIDYTNSGIRLEGGLQIYLSR
jgi:outer membrane protein